MEKQVVLSMVVAAAMAVSPAFAAKKHTGLQAPTPKQTVEQTGS
jgi:hypothetical protein